MSDRRPVWLPSKVHKQLKVRCAKLGIEIQEAAVRAVRLWLKEINPTPKK